MHCKISSFLTLCRCRSISKILEEDYKGGNQSFNGNAVYRTKPFKPSMLNTTLERQCLVPKGQCPPAKLGNQLMSLSSDTKQTQTSSTWVSKGGLKKIHKIHKVNLIYLVCKTAKPCYLETLNQGTRWFEKLAYLTKLCLHLRETPYHKKVKMLLKLK